MTIYRNKNIVESLLYFSVTKSFQKVKREMDFGHFSTFKKCPKMKTQKKF